MLKLPKYIGILIPSVFILILTDYNYLHLCMFPWFLDNLIYGFCHSSIKFPCPASVETKGLVVRDD